MRHSPLFLFFCSCVGSLAFPRGAQMVFTNQYTCPQDRVTAQARPDVAPHTLLASGGDTSAPPDIARDPSRLALWNQKQGQANRDLDRYWQTFEVRGCDQDLIYICSRPDLDEFNDNRDEVAGDDRFLMGSDPEFDPEATHDTTVLSAVRCLSNKDHITASTEPKSAANTDATLKDIDQTAADIGKDIHGLVRGVAEKMLGAGQFMTSGRDVEAVRADSNVGKAGLKAGDVILAIDGHAIPEDRATAGQAIDDYFHAPDVPLHTFHVQRGKAAIDLMVPASDSPPVTAH